jgi:hypothetical protein
MKSKLGFTDAKLFQFGTQKFRTKFDLLMVDKYYKKKH